MHALTENKYENIEALVTYLVDNAMTISVFDEESWTLKRSTDIKAIMSDINSVDMPECRVRDLDGNIAGWFGIADNEVYDYTENELFNIYFD